jgi:hypothetical protein
MHDYLSTTVESLRHKRCRCCPINTTRLFSTQHNR